MKNLQADTMLINMRELFVMVTWFYFFVFVSALLMTGRFWIHNKNVDTVFMLFIASVTINCFGRYVLAQSDCLETAIIANKILYVGACYAPLLTVMVLARLCNSKLPQALLFVLTLYSTVVMCLVLTIGKYGIYYQHVELGHGNGYNYLMKTYGPLHSLYPVMMLLYASVMLFYVIYALRRRREISFRTVAAIGGVGFLVIVMYIVERLIGSNISFLMVGYLLGIALLTKYFERINMYDMSTNIMNSIEKMKEYGYIVFDDKYRYISANNFAKELFPEIKSWIVDVEVPASDSYLYRGVVQYLMGWDKETKTRKMISVKNCYFELQIRTISYRKKQDVGYLQRIFFL